MTTAAAIDRLVHHSVILELNIKSFRLEEALQSAQQPGDDREDQAAPAEGKAVKVLIVAQGKE